MVLTLYQHYVASCGEKEKKKKKKVATTAVRLKYTKRFSQIKTKR
jgi:hypothetical protein